MKTLLNKINIFKTPYKWLKQLFWIVKNFDTEIERIEHSSEEAYYIAEDALDLMRERTESHLDVSLSNHDLTRIIICGRYKNNDYVEIFSVSHDAAEGLIRVMKNLQKSSNIKYIDAPLNFKAYLEHEQTIF